MPSTTASTLSPFSTLASARSKLSRTFRNLPTTFAVTKVESCSFSVLVRRRKFSKSACKRNKRFCSSSILASFGSASGSFSSSTASSAASASVFSAVCFASCSASAAACFSFKSVSCKALPPFIYLAYPVDAQTSSSDIYAGNP